MDTRIDLPFQAFPIPRVIPENCIGYGFRLLETKLLEFECGQALGLLVLLRFTHYCAST